jgi:hypothetical protein
MKVPTQFSGRDARQQSTSTNLETITNELALLSLGHFEPLKIWIDTGRYLQEIEQFNNEWVDYLPRADRVNNRRALTVTNLPGRTHRDFPSLAEASFAAKKRLSELDFCEPTDVYRACTSLHPLLDMWKPLGRSFIVQCNMGGYFVPHRDHPTLPRECFRLIVFLNNCGPLQYDWLMDDKKMQIHQGQVYYVNTKMTHRTISWIDNSQHLILNVPFNSENVAKVIANLAHTH